MIFLQPDSKSSSRSKLHLQPILSFYITIFMPVILSLFIRIYTVAENFSPEHPFRQETQIQIHRACFPIGQSSDDPVFPHPPGSNDIFSHFPLQYPGFIGHNG